jgi:hypothetical protein
MSTLIEPCNQIAPELAGFSETVSGPYKWRGKMYVFSSMYMKTRQFIFRLTHRRDLTGNSEILNLKPGEWVEVRSFKEILGTFDGDRKSKGMAFMPEMEKFCGKRFKVLKKIEFLRLESTGEVRKLRSPTVLLDGVYCDGENYGKCGRSCFHLWREIWLKRIQ